MKLTLQINGETEQVEAPARELLIEVLRDRLHLTGTKEACEVGECGSCTVLLDGTAVRSCLMFAVQVNGRQITTVEGLTASQDHMHPLQDAFREAHGLQCGFCTPGILMTLLPFLEENPLPSEQEIRAALSGNLCRCTGYQHIVDAVKYYLQNEA